MGQIGRVSEVIRPVTMVCVVFWGSRITVTIRGCHETVFLGSGDRLRRGPQEGLGGEGKGGLWSVVMACYGKITVVCDAHGLVHVVVCRLVGVGRVFLGVGVGILLGASGSRYSMPPALESVVPHRCGQRVSFRLGRRGCRRGRDLGSVQGTRWSVESRSRMSLGMQFLSVRWKLVMRARRVGTAPSRCW